MRTGLALGGWVAALAAAGLGVAARRALASRREGVARALHEARGGLCAASLGLQLAGRLEELPPARVRALELELGRAALALEDLERRRPPLARELVDVRELVADSVEAWRPAAASRGAGLRLSFGDGDAEVVGHRLRLARATGNLIANAIEHGGGIVEVRGCVDRGAVKVEVTDSGAGLPAPVAELMSGSRRGRGGRGCGSRRGTGARGRGLSIASEVAQAHGGRLAAAPSDRGARLVLELPLAVKPVIRLGAG